jgi:hypothetical protein
MDERKIDRVAHVVVLEVNGDLGDRDLLSLADERAREPAVPPEFSLPMVLRQADGCGMTSGGVRALASRALVLSPASRRAVGVPSELGYGRARAA